MKKLLRRVRGAVVMGLTWAVVWAPVGVLIGMIVDPDGSMDEMWVAIGAYPGFLGGVVFATVLGIAGRHRRFDELSLPRFAAWGAVAGLLVGTLPFTVGDATTRIPLWLLAGTVIGSITLLSALSAAGSLALARRAQKREPLAAGSDGDDGTALAGASSPRHAGDSMPSEVSPRLTTARPDDSRRDRSDRPAPVRTADADPERRPSPPRR